MLILDSGDALTGNIIFSKCFGGTSEDKGYKISETPDGKYIISGLTSSNDGDVSGYKGLNDCWIFKIDSSGNLIWQKCLGGSGVEGPNLGFNSILGNGNILGAVPTSSNDGDVSGNHGGIDIWLFTLNSSNGNIIWSQCYGGSNDEESLFCWPTDDGGYIVGGYSKSNDGDLQTNKGSADVWILKLDSSGNYK